MQKIQLSIPQPCQQSWQQMTPTEQGRYCKSCAKEVIDFSMMTDAEVLRYFMDKAHEPVCGRVLPEQLNRIISQPVMPKKRLFWYWNYLVMFLMFFGKGNTAKSQGAVKPVTEQNPGKSCSSDTNRVTIRGGLLRNTVPDKTSGQITDNEGLPVPFASVIIKGTNYGTWADANGVFMISVKIGDILIISAVAYQTVVVEVKNHDSISVLLQKSANSGMLGGLHVGGITLTDGIYVAPDKQKFSAVITVKDDQTASCISNARITFSRYNGGVFSTLITDRNGRNTIREIRPGTTIDVRVEADGYEPNEFIISGSDFENRKQEWIVQLRPQQLIVEKQANRNIQSDQPIFTVGGVRSMAVDGKPIYVVDGSIIPDTDSVSPEDIAEISILQGPAAAALFGPVGANGAVLIVTKKAREKTMDTVAVRADIGALKIAGGMMLCRKTSFYQDIRAAWVTRFTDSIKVFPNPAQRNNHISVQLTFKNNGNFIFQIANSAGSIVFQKTVSVVQTEYTENIQLDGSWSGGIYFIRVFDSNNTLLRKSRFFIQ